MLPAIETPAQKGPAMIDRATGSAQIHALAVLLRGQQENPVAGIRVSCHPNLVRFHLVALPGMQKQRLFAPAALGTAVAGHFRLTGCRQLSF